MANVRARNRSADRSMVLRPCLDPAISRGCLTRRSRSWYDYPPATWSRRNGDGSYGGFAILSRGQRPCRRRGVHNDQEPSSFSSRIARSSNDRMPTTSSDESNLPRRSSSDRTRRICARLSQAGNCPTSAFSGTPSHDRPVACAMSVRASSVLVITMPDHVTRATRRVGGRIRCDPRSFPSQDQTRDRVKCPRI